MRIFLPSFLFKCPFYGCFIPSVWILLGILLDISRVLFAASLGLAYGKGVNLWSIGEASAVGREWWVGSAERNGKCGKEREVVWEVAADSGGEDKIKAPTGQGIQWERW